MSFVSSEAIQKARRIALRGRSAVACVPCKEAKTKCNDYRPCARCRTIKQENLCRDEVRGLCFSRRTRLQTCARFDSNFACGFTCRCTLLCDTRRAYKCRPTTYRSEAQSPVEQYLLANGRTNILNKQTQNQRLISKAVSPSHQG